MLRPMLKAGDELRATRAECCAHEATFVFSHWEGGWIMSKSGRSIAPTSVYSVNGQIQRFLTVFIGPLQPDPPRRAPKLRLVEPSVDADEVPF